jgi:hypothetical protein
LCEIAHIVNIVNDKNIFRLVILAEDENKGKLCIKMMKMVNYTNFWD